VAKRVKDSVVCSLARAGRADIDRAAEALAPAARKRIHTFIATSPLHMRVKLQKTPEQVHEAVIDSVIALRARLPLPLHRERDRGRGRHDQHPGHGRLRLSRRVRRPDPDDQEPGAEHR
jgi:2-isopropylmalate synthase